MAKTASLFQLGMDLGSDPRKAQTEGQISNRTNVTSGPWRESQDDRKDHFIVRDGKVCAGTHLIVDLWGAERLDELDHVRSTLIESVEVAGATLLHIHLHHFTPNGGISGVAVLAESHISIHTGPERGYAALDIFMCGDAQPMKAIPVLERAFKPTGVKCDELLRGETGS
ncbi:adenosylmethionine decarboxylase [Azospirillum brasilense]|nr:adenosylmethionine decarboxylase [Azospirillum brasilense]